MDLDYSINFYFNILQALHYFHKAEDGKLCSSKGDELYLWMDSWNLKPKY